MMVSLQYAGFTSFAVKCARRLRYLTNLAKRKPRCYVGWWTTWVSYAAIQVGSDLQSIQERNVESKKCTLIKSNIFEPGIYYSNRKVGNIMCYV